MTTPAPDLAGELQPLLAAYQDIWGRLKPTELRGLWDPAEQAPYYVAEEIAEPLWTWETIGAYWRAAEQALDRFSLRTWDLHCKPIAPDVAALQFMMHWNGVIKGSDPAPIGLDVRVSALARKTASGWKFTCHYVESPLGALPYIRASYRGNVDPGF